MAIYSPVSDKSQLGEPIVPVDHGGLIAGLIVSILLIVIVIAALFYYRRRISHLKSELAHVQYIADPSSAPGTSPLAQVAPLFSDSAPFLEGKVWSLAVVGRSESKKRETLFFFLCLIMGRSSSFRQSSVLLSYGRSYGIRCRRRFEQHSHPQRPWLRRQQEQLDQFGTGEIGSQRSRRRLFWRLGLLSSANHNLFFFKNNKNFLDQRSLRRLSVEHGRVVQEPRSRHGQSQFAQFQHLPHDRRGEGVQERRAPLRRDQTQEQRLRWVFFFFSCLVPLWQFLFSLLRWLGYVDTSPQVSSWSTSSLCERLETDSRFVVVSFFFNSRRGVRPTGRFTTTYRGPAAIFADRFRIAGFFGRAGRSLLSPLHLSRRQCLRLCHLRLRRRRSGDNTALAISRRWSVFFFFVVVAQSQWQCQSLKKRKEKRLSLTFF